MYISFHAPNAINGFCLGENKDVFSQSCVRHVLISWAGRES